MKYGTINAPILDPSKKGLFWVQTKSAWESALKAHAFALTGSTEGKDFLESCGPHSAVNALTAISPDPSIYDTVTPGGWPLRAPDVLMNFFNSPSNQAAFTKIVAGVDFEKVFENEFALLYPLAMKAVFGVHCRVVMTHTWDDLVTLVKSNKSVQATKVRPGHYITFVGFDDESNTLSYIDPNPRIYPNGNWYDVRMAKEEHDVNIKPHIVVYGG